MKRPSSLRLVCVTVLCAIASIGSSLPAQVRAEARAATASAYVSPITDIRPILQRLGGTPCPDSAFTCIKQHVPLDHYGPSAYTNVTIDVTFAVLPASGQRKGMLVYATGGPGTAGTLYADAYKGYFDPSIPEHFDLVFYDQRGMNTSGGFVCPDEITRYYQADGRADTLEREQALIATSRTFAQSCSSKLTSADRLPFYGTVQAVEDLEAFRAAVGEDKFWLIGESYGTQFSQWYTSKHPQRIAGLVIDGVVDLTINIQKYLATQAQAFNDTLVKTADACTADATCRSQTGGNALATYDALAAQLNAADPSVKFPLPNGQNAKRPFAFGDLETVASGQMYNQTDRMLFLRALAYAARGDLVPMTRLLYVNLGVDETTLVPDVSYDYSDAGYYAVECNDYKYFNGTPDQKAEKYVRYGDGVDSTVQRLRSIYYGDLPCAFWPNATFPQPPFDQTPMANVPTLVLNATADPATPFFNSQRVYKRLGNAAFIVQRNGPHVISYRGVPCIDDLVTNFLVNDQFPDKSRTNCKGKVIEAYVPIAPENARDFANPLDAMIAMENEITYLPEYYNWDGKAKTSTGCASGDTLTFETVGKRIDFTLAKCAFTKGFVMNGTGNYDADKDKFVLRVNVSGYKAGFLKYVRNGKHYSVIGDYGGQPVNLSR